MLFVAVRAVIYSYTRNRLIAVSRACCNSKLTAGLSTRDLADFASGLRTESGSNFYWLAHLFRSPSVFRR